MILNIKRQVGNNLVFPYETRPLHYSLRWFQLLLFLAVKGRLYVNYVFPYETQGTKRVQVQVQVRK